MWKDRGLSKKQKVSIVIGIISLFVAGAILPNHFSITLSPSLPYNLFYLDKRVNLLEKGSYVLFTKSHHLIDDGEEFNVIKKIVCIEGDVFQNKGRDYYCNGTYLGAAKNKTLKGEPLESFIYSGVIPENQYAVFSSHEDSFDTRYFGLVKKEEIKALALPLW